MDDSAMPLKHSPVITFTASPVFSLKDFSVNVAPDLLGEGPVWDHRSERLYWVDILGRGVNCYDVGRNLVARIGLKEDMAGFAVPTTQPNILLCGSQHGLFHLTLDSARVTRLSHPERNIPRNRFNDAKVDPAGRLYCGTMQMKEKPTDVRQKGSGRLYCVKGPHANPVVVEAAGKVTVSNGMGWSPEGDKFYYIDTQTQQVQRWEYDVAKGEMEMRRVVHEMPTSDGARPDGMCVDAQGFLWIAAVGAGEVRRVDPVDGTVVAVVKVPTPLVTSCCFGGAYLSTLFITTARHTSDVDAALENPDTKAGLLYSVDVGVSGLPMTPFNMSSSHL